MKDLRKSPLAFAFAVLLTGCAMDSPSPDRLEQLQPEQATGLQKRPGWLYSNAAVAAANPVAAKTGEAILQQGGNAIDAAIATQLVLGLVEPQSSGIGGGGFLMVWDGDELIAWDGRETAPEGATSALFLDAKGQPLPFMQAVASGASVGVPGLLAMLEQAHQRHGQLPWSDLFKPAIKLAEKGFKISPRLHQLLAVDPLLKQNAAARRFYYTPEGEARPVGERLKNPALAAIYRQVAEEGAAVFYQGTIAENLVAAVHSAPGQPSHLNTTDLTDYQPWAREALCVDWLEFLVCGMPPPSSGQVTLMQILGLLEILSPSPGETEAEKPQGLVKAEQVHYYIEASKLAFADRAHYLADPAFVAAPAGDWSSLLKAEYLSSRASQVSPVALQKVEAGRPQKQSLQWAPQPEQPEYGTTHISIIDAQGQAVAMTSSIEQAFGSRLLVDGGTGLAGGYLLNNQLTDFSFTPQDDQGKPIANRVEPGKRPRSSMAPTLVFNPHAEEVVASLGSPGGAAIIHYTAKTLLGMLQWQLSPQEAIELPNLVNLNDATTLLEKNHFKDYLKMSLEARGHQLLERDLTSGIQALLVTPQGILGGADPRREGWVSGH